MAVTFSFELWCWRRLLWVPWTARTSNQSVLKEISPGCSLEGLMLKLKSNTLATWCEELIHLKRPWCWERFKVGGEGDDRGLGGWMAPPTQWTWVWVNSESWWCAGSQHGSSHPWQRSCGEAWYAKASQDSRGPPWTCLSIYPKTRICFTILRLSPTPLTLTGGYPQPPFSKGNQLRAS